MMPLINYRISQRSKLRVHTFWRLQNQYISSSYL